MSIPFTVAILIALFTTYLSGLAIVGDHIHRKKPSFVADILLWLASTTFLGLFGWAMFSMYSLSIRAQTIIILAVFANLIAHPIIHFATHHRKEKNS